MKQVLAGAVLLAWVPCAAADALDQVRDQLNPLKGTNSIQVALERQIAREQKDKPRATGQARVTVSAGPAGLTVTYAPGELQRAEAEARQTDPELPKPASLALGSLDAVEIGALMSSAASLLNDLDGATLRSEAAVSYQGRPARLLELTLAVPLSKSAKKHIRSVTSSMKLWIAADGLPLAAENQSVFEGRIFLVGFEGSEFQSREFVRAGDRLLAVREVRRNEASGLGEWSKDERVTTLKLP